MIISSTTNTVRRSTAFMVVFVALVTAVVPVAAQVLWKPPKVSGSFPPGLKASVPVELLTRSRVLDMTVHLDKTPMENVRARFEATVGTEGDASEYFGWLCVQGLDAEGRWALWFSHGEIDGDNVSSFQWRRLAPDAKVDRRCPMLSSSAQAIELPAAIKLGTAQDQVLRILGRPTARRGNTLLYVHEHPDSTQGQSYMSHNSVAIVFRGDIVDTIAVHKYKISP